MKKPIFLALISIFLLSSLTFLLSSLTGCGGGASSSSAPPGEQPSVPFSIELRPSQYIAQTNSFIIIRARVFNGNGNAIPNVPVTFTNLSAVGQLSATSANTNSNGFAEVKISSTTPGFSTVQAQIYSGESVVRDRRTLFFTLQNILQVGMNMSVDSVPGNGIFNEANDLILFNPPPAPDDTVEILATVLDAGGVPVGGGVAVAWDSDHKNDPTTNPTGEVHFIRADSQTDVFGQAQAIIQVTPESIRDTDTLVNVMASAGNGAAGMVTLFLRPVVVSSVTVSADPQTVEVGGDSTITAVVALNTGAHAPDGTTVGFTTSCGTVTPFAQTVGGVATATFTAPQKVGTCTITVTAGGVSGTTDVVVTVPLSVQPDTQTVLGGNDAVFTIFGGIPGYTVTSSDPAVAFNGTAGSGTWTVASAGDTFTVKTIAVTKDTDVTLTVRDAVGTTVTATLTVTSTLPDFTITCDKSTLSIPQGSHNNTTTCTVGSQNGFSNAVNLSCPSAPPGMSCVFATNPVTPPADSFATSALDVLVAGGTSTGTSTLTVQGSAGSLTHVTTIAVTVAP
jgi:hypothetical protein